MKKALSAAFVIALASTVVLAGAQPSEAATISLRALSVAAAHKGDPYRYGAAGPAAFDCSGLTYYSYRVSGQSIPRTAQQQYWKTHHVSPWSRQRGDLVFIGTSAQSIYHVGIYAGFWSGKGWMWNANSGSYRGRQVVLAPIAEYTAGSPRAYYGRF